MSPTCQESLELGCFGFWFGVVFALFVHGLHPDLIYFLPAVIGLGGLLIVMGHSDEKRKNDG